MRPAGPARRQFLKRTGLAALSLLGAPSCAHLFGPGMLLEDHPLAGRIWDVDQARFVDVATVVGELRRAAIVLLGESHDNPHHHRIQLDVIDALSAAGERRALAMEQFDVEHQAAIDDALRQTGSNAQDVARAGSIDRTGWDWPLYRPLVDKALERRMPVVAANLSRSAARAVVTGGFAALGERAARLPLDSTWSGERERIMSDLIAFGHCGQAPQNIVRGIVLAQRARDATMADAIAPHAGRGVVAILGRGHARRDIGVPIYLKELAPDAAVRVVGLVEVAAGRTYPAAYAEEEGAAAYDYLWFTARVARPDPCAGLRREKLPGVTGQ